jgi:hypothetical protein
VTLLLLIDFALHSQQPVSIMALRSRSGKLWEYVIGIEVHAQITAQTKLFSRTLSLALRPDDAVWIVKVLMQLAC